MAEGFQLKVDRGFPGSLRDYPGNLLGPHPPPLSLIQDVYDYSDGRVFFDWNRHLGRWMLKRVCPDIVRAIALLQDRHGRFIPCDRRVLAYLDRTNLRKWSLADRRIQIREARERKQRDIENRIRGKWREFYDFLDRAPSSNLKPRAHADQDDLRWNVPPAPKRKPGVRLGTKYYG